MFGPHPVGWSANSKLSPDLSPEVVAEANLRIARNSGVVRFGPCPVIV